MGRGIYASIDYNLGVLYEKWREEHVFVRKMAINEVNILFIYGKNET